ncbi:septum site-determining protein MinC [Desulfuribacillus stibiiarsenatis]|uniref:Probable septum site-determining protein MinC n=1 Tax=Desulfuribacillus stibiiarsenatis TaxID=1390249 RepID=A0A1E5L281_9FIRM|nr:septum site-determining protein MinC [Desulfuribacillus stibiiarsenatis]OEH84237.1 septum site-determining protein MinC [Desulfuribacillus stibiiarsenatis]
MEEKDVQPQPKKKNLVTIKGSNEGLSFILNDEEPFSYVAEELKQKVRRELSTLLTGPMVRIKIDCGSREITDKQRKLLEEIIALKENLILTRIDSVCTTPDLNLEQDYDNSSGRTEGQNSEQQKPERQKTEVVHIIHDDSAKLYRGTIRSGQVIEHDGNLVIYGDVNSGAKVMATGDIMVLGRIMGLVHAGSKGDKERVVAGSSWGSIQVRIADCIGKATPTSQEKEGYCLTIAYLDEYRIQFQHKKHLTN